MPFTGTSGHSGQRSSKNSFFTCSRRRGVHTHHNEMAVLANAITQLQLWYSRASVQQPLPLQKKKTPRLLIHMLIDLFAEDGWVGRRCGFRARKLHRKARACPVTRNILSLRLPSRWDEGLCGKNWWSNINFPTPRAGLISSYPFYPSFQCVSSPCDRYSTIHSLPPPSSSCVCAARQTKVLMEYY